MFTAKISTLTDAETQMPAASRSPHTVTLYVASNTILPGAEPRWYVCTERPHRYEAYRLDAPWIYAGDEDGARHYALTAVHAYRNHPRIRYEIVEVVS